MAQNKLFPSVERLNQLFDYDPVMGVFRWKHRRSPTALAGSVAGTINADGYVVIGIDGKDYYAHRLVWFIEHGECPDFLDHEDTNRSHNWESNLRPATKVENGRNRSAPRQNTSGFKGVSWAKRERRWRSTIQVNRKHVGLGYFLRIEDAVAAYKEAAIKYHGEYANTAGPQSLDLS